MRAVIETREGNEIHKPDSPIRQAIPQQSKCKSCHHLGDLCLHVGRDFETIVVNDSKRRLVTRCESYEEVKN